MNNLCEHDQKILDSITSLCEVTMDENGERILVYKGLQLYFREYYGNTYQLYSSDSFGSFRFEWQNSKNNRGKQLKKPRTNVKTTVEEFELKVMEQVLANAKNLQRSIRILEERKELMKKKLKNILTEQQWSEI